MSPCGASRRPSAALTSYLTTVLSRMLTGEANIGLYQSATSFHGMTRSLLQRRSTHIAWFYRPQPNRASTYAPGSNGNKSSARSPTPM